MTAHLPECIYEPEHWDVEQSILWGGKPCICPAIRACEQRVLDDDVLAAAHHGQKGYEIGFRKGLDAAREAVAALEPLLDRSKHEGGYDCCGCATVGYLWTDALDAIDALKESE